MRRLPLFIVAALALVIPASAAPLPPPGSGDLANINLPVRLHEAAHFKVVVPKGLKNPRLVVACYQDVDEDGWVEVGSVEDIVYGANVGKESKTGEAGPESVPYDIWTIADFGGFISIWTQRGGGLAYCTADLLYYRTGNREWNGKGQQEAVILASIVFTGNPPLPPDPD